jgi:hypothetical protein
MRPLLTTLKTNVPTRDEIAVAGYAPDLVLDSIVDLARAHSRMGEQAESGKRRQVGAR